MFDYVPKDDWVDEMADPFQGSFKCEVCGKPATVYVCSMGDIEAGHHVCGDRCHQHFPDCPMSSMVRP